MAGMDFSAKTATVREILPWRDRYRLEMGVIQDLSEKTA